MSDPKNDEWRTIADAPMYEVSSSGKVRRSIPGQGTRAGLVLSPCETKKGYAMVHLSDNGRRFSSYVHRLVATAFIPNPNSHPQVNHIDSNKSNNDVSNLEWCTNRQNRSHAVRSMTHAFGSRHGFAKLSEIDVMFVRMWFDRGFSKAEIARAFGIGHPAVFKIVRNERWRHVA